MCDKPDDKILRIPYLPHKITLMRPILFTIALVCLMKCDVASQTQPILHEELYQKYDRYKEQSIKQRRFKHSDIVPLIKKLKPPFEVEVAGQSIEGRDIYLVKLGTGPINVLLWSQMHGDEPSATMAIMDMFNFFSQSDEFDPYRKNILDKVTLHFIPMLNPDGAEVYQRRNALGVDLNRDALRLQSPEARILKKIRDEIDAEWGFNLHDQNRYYGAGLNPHTATVSFLAPAYNYAKEVNENREKSMQLIGDMNDVLQKYIPGKVGKYNDDFEPRAFGDNIQKWGTSTILIESGGLKGDPEKQEIRKLNYVAIMTAFESIANGNFQKQSRENYENIPFNESNWFLDLILREVEVEVNDQWFTVDIGFRRSEVDYAGHSTFYHKSYIHDLGDLSIFYGYEDLNGQGLRAVPGKVYSKTVANADGLKGLNVQNLLSRGITTIQIKEFPKNQRMLKDFPLEVIRENDKQERRIRQGKNPSLLLMKDDKVVYAVINGFLISVK